MKKIVFGAIAIAAVLVFAGYASDSIPSLDTSDSLTGIDANANGIRDDIEAYIEKTYTDEKQRKAVMQFARSMQETLLVDMTNKEAARKIAKEVQKRDSIAMDCIFLAFDVSKGDENPSKTWRKVRSMTTNTKARLKAHLAFNQALNGTVLYSGSGDCD
ncbi:hypothetical protein FACS189487_01700 [Campylobacterota bacterium]|nr:hypothetical protein FACS189487_01700 [Campylobacterota bacterium]